MINCWCYSYSNSYFYPQLIINDCSDSDFYSQLIIITDCSDYDYDYDDCFLVIFMNIMNTFFHHIVANTDQLSFPTIMNILTPLS